MLQPLRPVFFHNQVARSSATLQLRLSRRLTCQWISKRPRRSPFTVLLRVSRAALESTSSGRLLLHSLSCRHPSCLSAYWHSPLGPAIWALTALGTWWQPLHNAVAGKRFASTTLSAPHAASSGFLQPTSRLPPPPVGPEVQTAADRTTEGSMSTGIGQHSDAFTSWSNLSFATGQSCWTETTEVFLDEGPTVHGGPSAFGGRSV